MINKIVKLYIEKRISILNVFSNNCISCLYVIIILSSFKHHTYSKQTS